MPTYAYRCTQCSHEFDIYQSFTDDALTECPECGGLIRKVLSSVGVVFKGSGFYRNDSRAGAKGGAGTSDSLTSTSSSSSAKESSSSSDSSSSTASSSTTSSTTPAAAPAKPATTAKPAAS